MRMRSVSASKCSCLFLAFTDQSSASSLSGRQAYPRSCVLPLPTQQCCIHSCGPPVAGYTEIIMDGKKDMMGRLCHSNLGKPDSCQKDSTESMLQILRTSLLHVWRQPSCSHELRCLPGIEWVGHLVDSWLLPCHGVQLHQSLQRLQHRDTSYTMLLPICDYLPPPC